MSTDHLSDTFFALSDPTRRAILARLASGEATVNELAAPSNLRQPTISKHIKVLETAGLISRGRDAQRRPCRLEPDRLRDVSVWIDHYRHLWSDRFDRLDTYLEQLQTKKKKGK